MTRFCALVAKASLMLAVALLLVLILCVQWQVFGRYVLNDTPTWAENLALLLVPALAFDNDGIRLGYGGGWYDRLRADPAWRRVPALAVLPAACRMETLPRDPWDVPFDGWLDETGLHWIGGAPGLEGQAARA